MGNVLAIALKFKRKHNFVYTEKGQILYSKGKESVQEKNWKTMKFIYRREGIESKS